MNQIIAYKGMPDKRGLLGSQESKVQTDSPVTMHVHLLQPSPFGYTAPVV